MVTPLEVLFLQEGPPMRAAGIRHSAASVSPNVPGKEELEYGNNIPIHREIQQARTERKLTQKELSVYFE